MEFEVAWSAALERAGAVPGLSSYQGRSSIYHSASWEQVDSLDHGECKFRTGPVVQRSRKRITVTPEAESEILKMLHHGRGYGTIAKLMGCSEHVPRRIAAQHGICRAYLGGRPKRAAEAA